MPNESQRLLLEAFDKEFRNEFLHWDRMHAFILKAYQQGVKDSLGKLPKARESCGHWSFESIKAYNRAIRESEASIKSLIE